MGKGIVLALMYLLPRTIPRGKNNKLWVPLVVFWLGLVRVIWISFFFFLYWNGRCHHLARNHA